MADLTNEQEKQVKSLKRRLEGWRELVLLFHAVLTWQKNWYPALITGITTVLFLILYSIDPSLLTSLSIVGLCITLVDYLVPLISSALYSSESWTGNKEKELEEICRDVIKYYNRVVTTLASFHKMRNSKAFVYYGIVVLVFLSLAWIGGKFNNLLLSFFIVTSLLLTPGFRSNGMLSKYSAHMMSFAQNALRGDFAANFNKKD